MTNARLTVTLYTKGQREDLEETLRRYGVDSFRAVVGRKAKAERTRLGGLSISIAPSYEITISVTLPERSEKVGDVILNETTLLVRDLRRDGFEVSNVGEALNWGGSE